LPEAAGGQKKKKKTRICGFSKNKHKQRDGEKKKKKKKKGKKRKKKKEKSKKPLTHNDTKPDIQEKSLYNITLPFSHREQHPHYTNDVASSRGTSYLRVTQNYTSHGITNT